MTPITNELIAEIICRLVASLHPEEIILFGSYAWGIPHQYSDLDLCVILPNDIPEFDRIEWGFTNDRHSLDSLHLRVSLGVADLKNKAVHFCPGSVQGSKSIKRFGRLAG